MTLPAPCICLVTDRRGLAPDARTTRDEVLALERQLDEAMGAGVDLIQLRERDLDAATLCALAVSVVARAPARTRLVVNDRADVALAARAAGVHLPADGPDAARVRTLGPAGWLVGRSVHSAEAAREAAGADYLIFGTVFRSRSKPGDAPVAGLDALREAATATSRPVLAIGGVTPATVGECQRAGAAGIAAISVFFPRGRTPDSLGAAEAVAALRRAWT